MPEMKFRSKFCRPLLMDSSNPCTPNKDRIRYGRLILLGYACLKINFRLHVVKLHFLTLSHLTHACKSPCWHGFFCFLSPFNLNRFHRLIHLVSIQRWFYALMLYIYVYMLMMLHLLSCLYLFLQ